MAKDELFKKAEELLFSYIEKTIEIKNLEVEINFIERGYNISLPGEAKVSYSDIKVQSNSHYSIDEWLLLHNKNYDYLITKRLRLVNSIKKIENALELLNDNEKKIVKLRYFDNLSWFNISKRLDYSESHCKLLRVKAINKIKRILL